MDNRYKNFIPVIIVLIFLTSLSIYYLLPHENSGIEESDIQGEKTSFILRANTSDIDSVNIETNYLSVDDMYNLDSPEIKLESETCLRFYNYSGSVDIKNKRLEGTADGFATCTLNGTIDLTIEESIDNMWKVSTRELENSKDFAFNAEKLYINPTDSTRTINESNKQVKIEDFNGKLELYPPTGINLYGEAKLAVGNETL